MDLDDDPDVDDGPPEVRPTFRVLGAPWEDLLDGDHPDLAGDVGAEERGGKVMFPVGAPGVEVPPVLHSGSRGTNLEGVSGPREGGGFRPDSGLPLRPYHPTSRG